MFYSNTSSLALSKFVGSLKKNEKPNSRVTNLDIAQINYSIVVHADESTDIRFAKEWTESAYEMVGIYKKIMFGVFIVAYFLPLVTLLKYDENRDLSK